MTARKRKLILVCIFLVICSGGLVAFNILFQCEMTTDRIVVITIDSLRADHLGAYGYIRNTSPFFDQLAKSGILFKNHVASMATTVPSHASLFTSQYPLQHGVLKNGHKLGNEFLTMAEAFREMGYDTAGIVSTVGQFKEGNLHQGFNYFNEPEKLQIFKVDQYRSAEDTIQVAIDWLNAKGRNDKFFLWIHLFDPHTPLHPPQQYYDSLLASSRSTDLVTYWIEEQRVAEEYFSDQKQMIERITQYDAEIRYVDDELQRLFQYYKRQNFDRDSVWIITADHGQGVGNHRWWGHGKHIYNEQLRIPLLFYFSSGKGTNHTIDTLVEDIDIFPTLLGLSNNLSPILKTLQGVSLLPIVFQDPSIDLKKYAFSQRRNFAGPVPQEILPEKTNYEEGETYSLQSTHYKYIHRTQGIDEFFDLRNDPYEMLNLINKGIEEEQSIRQALLQKIAELKQSSSNLSISVDEKAIEELKSLGYVQ